jgi:hypothetical protein
MHFMVSSGTMKSTGSQKTWKKTTAGDSLLRAPAVAVEDVGEDEAHHAEEQRRRDIGARADEQQRISWLRMVR